MANVLYIMNYYTSNRTHPLRYKVGNNLNIRFNDCKGMTGKMKEI